MTLKHFIRQFDFLRTYRSPFKPLKLRWYFGKTAIGLPYFLPRTWVKYTRQEAIVAATKKLNKLNENEHTKKIGFEKLYADYCNTMKPVPKKIGFDFVPLGWKTKWTDTDYRFEWSPVWSFVFFGYQIAVTFEAPEMDNYWECWLCYTRNTDKTKSVEERLAQARKEFPCVWTTNRYGVGEEVCYWDLILKETKSDQRNKKLKKLGI